MARRWADLIAFVTASMGSGSSSPFSSATMTEVNLPTLHIWPETAFGAARVGMIVTTNDDFGGRPCNSSICENKEHASVGRGPVRTR